MPTSLARNDAWVGPAPPNGSSVKLRASSPLREMPRQPGRHARGRDAQRGVGHDLRLAKVGVATLSRDRAQRATRQFAIEPHPPAEKMIRIDPAIGHVAIRDRGPFATASVGGGAGRRAGARRAHFEQSLLVGMDDRTAARADRRNVD